jgi:S1-C subfamily serine protease
MPLTPRRIHRSSDLILGIVLALGATACSGSGTRKGSPAGPHPAAAASTPAAQASTASALQDAFESVIASVRPSIVEISTSTGLGSGVVYDDKGDIVTNAHVVGNESRFRVGLVDGRTLDGTLVGAYAPDDLAVVKVANGGGLSAAKFADSTQVKVGEIALAIGNPLGLASSVSDGIVSSTGRTVSEGGGVVLPSTIQTSAAINPGNSGGGLVDLNGEVMGIPTLAAVDPELGGSAAPGIGFAIPSNTVKLIADQLIKSGKVTNSGRAALGISGATATTFGGQPVGVLIRSVVKAQGADVAGIKSGDIITAVNGKPTPTLDDLQTVLADLASGQTASVDVVHPGGGKQTYKVTLGTL